VCTCMCVCVRVCKVGQNPIYIRCIYGIFGREITIYMVYIYGSGQPYVFVILCAAH